MRQFYYVIQTLLFDYSVECGYRSMEYCQSSSWK